MARILITGGSGLMGTNAVDYFALQGHNILNFDMRSPQNEDHNKYWHKGDINERDSYNNIVKEFKPEYFLHLAARTDLLEENDLQSGYKSNIGGLQNTIDIVNSTPSIKRVLFASSRLVCRIDYIPKSYDDYCPINLYGESKVIGEGLVKNGNINKNWCIFRPTSIWGPWFDSPYIIFFRTIKNNLYFHPGGYDPYKSFGYVKNAIFQLDKLMTAAEEKVNGKTFYLCDYPPINLKKWANLIGTEMNSKKIATYSVSLLKLLAPIGDLLAKLGWKRVPLTSFRLNNLIADMVYDTKELEQICGPLPYDLETGVKETVQWMNTHTNRDKLALTV